MFDLGTAVGYLMLDTTGFQKGFKDASRYLKTFTDKSTKLGDKIFAVGGIMQNVGGSMTKYVTMPLIGAGTAITTFAADAESAMSHFKASVGDVSNSMEDYKTVMEDVFKENYGENMMDVSSAMAEIVNRLGEMDPGALKEVTESAIALRDTFGYDVSESIRSVDALMKNFGLTSQEAFDFIVKGTQEGLDFSGEFLDTLNEYSVQFQKLGLDANDMFNILKAGADSGAWNLDKVGDAVKELSIRVIDGSETTAKGFAAIGLNANEMAAKFAQGGETAKGALQEMMQALQDMDDPVQQNIAGVNLFGTMWEDLGPDVIFQMLSIKDAAVDMNGAMDALKDAKYDNLTSALGGLWRSIQLAGASFGKYLIPKVEAAIDFISGLVEKFEGLSEGTKEGIVNFGLFAAALGPVLLVVGKVISLVTTLGPILGGLAAPIGIIIAAVAALSVAWSTNFAGIRDTASSILESIQSIVSSFLAMITYIWDNNLLGIRTIVETAWLSIQQVFSGAFQVIDSLFQAFAALFRGDWEGLWTAVQGIASGLWDIIQGLFVNFLNLIVSTLLGIGASLWEAATSAFNEIKSGFEEVWNNIKEWFELAKEDPVKAIQSLGTALYNAGVNAFNSLWDGLRSVWNSIVSWVEDAVSWIVDKVSFWQSESSKVNAGGGSSRSSGSHAAGLDYVPHDNYRAVLHEGESVWTKQQTKLLLNAMNTLSSGSGSGDMTVIVPVNGIELARATIKDFRRANAESPAKAQGR